MADSKLWRLLIQIMISYQNNQVFVKSAYSHHHVPFIFHFYASLDAVKGNFSKISDQKQTLSQNRRILLIYAMVIFYMNRNQQNLKRPSSSGAGKLKSTYSSPTIYEKEFTKTDPQHFMKCIHKPMMLNQNSCFRLTAGQRQTFAGWRSPTKPTFPFGAHQSTKKVYFTYINPSSLAIEKHFIETIIQIPNKAYSNEWEQKYFELQKQLQFFLSSHEAMAVELSNAKKQLRNRNSNNFVDGHNQPLIFYKTKLQQLSVSYEDLKVQANMFKNQNIKTQNALCEAQNQLLKYEQNQGFDEKLIYELKKDNQKMVKMLQRMDLHSQITQAQITINANLNEQNQTSGQFASKIKSMIADTFFKIDRITKGNNVEMIDKDSQIFKDLQVLQLYVLDLDECCQKLMQQIQIEQGNASLVYQHQYQAKLLQDQMVLKDQQFYKQENHNLQQKVYQLMDINNTLTQKVKVSFTNTDYQFWQNQSHKLKSQATQLYEQYSKLLAKYEDSEDKKEKLEEKVALFSMEIERLMHLIKENNNKIKTMQSYETSLQQLIIVKTELEGKALNLEHSNKELTQRVSQQLNELLLRQERIRRMEQKYELSNKLKLQLEVRIEELTVQLTVKQKLILSLQSQISIISNQLSCSIQKINEQQKTSQSQQMFYSQIEELKGIVGKVQKQNELLKLQMSKSKGTHCSFEISDIEYVRSLTLMIQTLVYELQLKETHTNHQIRIKLTQSFATLFAQIIKIYEHCSTSSFSQSQQSNNANQVQNQRIIAEFKAKVSVLESKIIESRSQNLYTAEFIRSILLEIDCLVQNIQEDPKNRQIMKIIGTEINKGLCHLSALI